MDAVNKTLYIPLYGKALVSRRRLILNDPKAEEIWAAEGFPLGGKSASKWLAYYMAMRARVFDRWLEEKLQEDPDVLVLHIGCGLDSRCLRVDRGAHLWIDVDFPEVIAQRKLHYREETGYLLLPGDVRQKDFLEKIPGGNAIVVMEGVSMYLRPEERTALTENLCSHFENLHLLMDCYTVFAARASRYKNPIREVGVSQVYGMDDPGELEMGGMSCVKEHPMTPEDLISQLPSGEQGWFRFLYGGSMARKLYRLYEYEKRDGKA